MISKSDINKILKEYEDMQSRAQADFEARKQEIYEKIPRIKEIDEEISNISINFTKSILKNSKQSQNLVEELHQKSIDLNMEKGELLASHNYPTDYLTIKYNCNDCKDTGFVDGEKCTCFKQKLINCAYNQSNLENLLQKENFDTFNFKYYDDTVEPRRGISPRKNMENIFKTCIDFVENFDSSEENLIFTGPTGLGKTFLSSCIAKDLLDRRKTVFYQTAFKIFDILEQYKFTKEKDQFNKDSINILFDVDLLIIDDLGTEFINSYTSSEFFNILNTRLLRKKKTIISTNLNMNELMKIYSARVVSRIIGHYKVLEFFGNDIRKKVSVNFS